MKSSKEKNFYSSITPYLKKQALLKLVIVAVPAALFLLVFALFATREIYDHYGFITFCLSILCITWGVIPFRKIRDLEQAPYQLKISSHSLTFIDQRKRSFLLERKKIKKVWHHPSEKLYGISLRLKHPLPDECKKWHLQSKKVDQECDLFFPYFRENQALELASILKDQLESDRAS